MDEHLTSWKWNKYISLILENMVAPILEKIYSSRHDSVLLTPLLAKHQWNWMTPTHSPSSPKPNVTLVAIACHFICINLLLFSEFACALIIQAWVGTHVHAALCIVLKAPIGMDPALGRRGLEPLLPLLGPWSPS